MNILKIGVMLWILCLLRSQYCFSNGQLGKTVIAGYIPDAKDKPVEVKVIIIKPESLAGENGSYTVTSVNGYFTIPVDVDRPREMIMEVDEKSIVSPFYRTLFVEPGDSLYFKIDKLSELGIQNVSCNGRGAEKINYLKEKFLVSRELSRKYFDDFKADSLAWRIEYNQIISQGRLKVLEKYRDRLNKNIFRILESEIIVSNYFYLLEKVVARWRSGNVALAELAHAKFNIDSLLAPLKDSSVAMALGGGYYPGAILMGAMLAYLERGTENIESNVLASFPVEKTYDILSEYLDGTNIKDFILAGYIGRRIMQKGNNALTQPSIRKFLDTYPPSNPYWQQVDELARRSAAGSDLGTILPAFELTDTSGRSVPLKDYLGKVVVLDFWFTGCNGCRDLVPYVDTLEQLLANRSDVVFLSVSTDEKKEIWIRKGIGKYSSMLSQQYYTGGLGTEHPIIKYLVFNIYPAIFIIGKKGELVSTRVTTPNIRTAKGREEFIQMVRAL